MPKSFISALRSILTPVKRANRTPNRSRVMKVGELETRIAIGHSALGKSTLSEHDLNAKLATWPWPQLVLKLGSIEHQRYFLSQADWNVDGLLFREFLRPECQEAAAPLLSRHGIIANQAATAYLVSRTLRLGATGPDRGAEDHADFADILLAANDVLYPNEAPREESLPGLEDQLARLLLFNAVLSHVDAPKHLLPRYYHLFGALADANQGEPGAVDIDAVLVDLIGATLNQTFAVCLGVFGHFTTLADRQKNAWAKGEDGPVKAGEFVLNRGTYLSKMGIADGGQQLLARLSTNPEISSGDQPKSAYDYEHLKSRPIVSLGQDRMAIPIPQLFFERATIMLWWDIHNSVPPDRQNAFESWWGYLTERYVDQLLEKALGPPDGGIARWFRHDQYRLKHGTPPSPDAIIVSHVDNGLALAFVEVKSSRPRYVDMVTGDAASLRKHWCSRLIGEPTNPKAVRQIDKGITNFLTGKLALERINPTSVRRIFPIVVTLDHWPMRSTLYEQFAEDVKAQGLLVQGGVTPVEIVSCEELEMLVGAAENGWSLVETFNQRWQRSEQSIPLRDWMSPGPTPSLLTEIWDRMSIEVKSGLSTL